MFTGIVEALGLVQKKSLDQGNLELYLQAPFLSELRIDQSLAHNGICLTVVEILSDSYRVTAIAETIQKTNILDWKVGDKVNLERCLRADARLDGHVVQGHVDTTGVCAKIQEENGSWLFCFEHPNQAQFLTVPKGSIAVNGTSLTVVNSGEGYFSVAIIPYTYEHTVFHQLKEGDRVNLEFDVLGKYIGAYLQRLAKV